MIFLLGSGFVTLSLFIMNWLGVPVSLLSLALSVTIFASLYLLYKRFVPKDPVRQKEAWSKVDYFFLTIIILLLLVVMINGLWGVVSTWDALTLYDFRALRIVETGSIAQSAQIQGNYFYAYPLFTSLAHVSLYLLGLTSPMIFYALLFTSFVFAFYQLLHRTLSRAWALFGSLLVIIAPHLFWHAQIAYTNLPYTIYLGLGAVYILEYARTGNRRDALFGAILTGLSTWVRSVEPFWLINIFTLLLITLSKQKFFDFLLSLVLFIPLERVWKVYVAMAHNVVAPTALGQVTNAVKTVATVVTNTTVSTSISKPIYPVITYFFANAVRPFVPVLALFALGIFFKVIHKSRAWLGEFMVFSYYCVAFYGTYIFSISQSYWDDIPGSLERMMMFISPIIIYNLFISIKDYNVQK